jgi:hypothetical protein
MHLLIVGLSNSSSLGSGAAQSSFAQAFLQDLHNSPLETSEAAVRWSVLHQHSVRSSNLRDPRSFYAQPLLGQLLVSRLLEPHTPLLRRYPPRSSSKTSYSSPFWKHHNPQSDVVCFVRRLPVAGFREIHRAPAFNLCSARSSSLNLHSPSASPLRPFRDSVASSNDSMGIADKVGVGSRSHQGVAR